MPDELSVVLFESPEWIPFSIENGLRETFHKNKYESGVFVPDITAEELYTAANYLSKQERTA